MNTEENNTQLPQSSVSVSVTDLRIGNYIQRNGSVATVEIINGELNEIYFLGEDFYFNDSVINLEPIPLTKEWHNNFGIKKTGFNDFEYKIKNKFNLYLTVIFTGDYVMIRQGEKKSIDDDMIAIWNKDLTKRDMYVHEWQNLYLSLSGSILTKCGLTEH